MSKICKQCGYEADDNSKFCIRCGAHFDEAEKTAGKDNAEEKNNDKIRAEWQGNDCKCNFSSCNTSYASSFRQKDGENERKDNGSGDFGKFGMTDEEVALRGKRATAVCAASKAKRRKVLFVLAFLGLLADFLFGFGVLLCLPVAIIASMDLHRLYREEKRVSSQLVWAVTVGWLGTVLGVIFFLLIL